MAREPKSYGGIPLTLELGHVRLIFEEIGSLSALLDKQDQRRSAMFDEYCKTGKVEEWEQAKIDMGLA